MTDSPKDQTSSNEAQPALAASNHVKRKRLMGLVVSLLLFCALAAGVMWWHFYKDFEITDDAYVTGDIIVLSSRQEGSVISCHAISTDFAREGDVLVALDPTDYRGRLDQKKAALAQASRRVRTLYEEVKQKRANVKLERAKYERAHLNLKNRQALLATEAIAIEEIENAEADLNVQSAGLELAIHQLGSAEASLGNASLRKHPDIENARTEVIETYLALSRCCIKAPVSGYIANKNVQVGQSIREGTPLMNIVPLHSLWVEANFKETQLQTIRIGQPVDLHAEMYGRNVIYHGKVEGILPGSGSTFSLLPTQNATGNWIKIVQRVPVRISLIPEEVKQAPLVLGLTMSVSVDISDPTGLQMAEKPLQQTAKTHVCEVNLDEIHAIMDRIIDENLQLPSET